MTSLTDPRCAMGAKSLVDGDTVAVVVGPDEVVFHIHEKLLRSKAAFFEAALGKEWKEGQDRAVELMDDDPDAFGGYAEWLYTGKLAVIESDGKTDFDLLSSMFGLGEKIIDDRFQNCVIDAFVAGTRVATPNSTGGLNYIYPGYHTVDSLYKVTPKGSPARRLMVEMYALQAGDGFINVEHPEENNHEFLVDLASSLLKNRTVCQDFQDKHEELIDGTPCSYHKHGKEETCAGETR
ncbi:hypothetical protein LTR12_012764 [Friedmanniomyces endolithicus]|nr:hypothetical protein LTR12_012764 [Friedmanniomyces endolithicus]